jgi:hypothetical protein
VRAVLAAALAVLFSASVIAAPRVSEAQARYQHERAACMDGSSNQDRATCLKEAAAAYQEAKAGQLPAPSDLARNRTARCEQLPVADRDDCVARMRDGTTTGSARDGGILREVTRPTR